MEEILIKIFNLPITQLAGVALIIIFLQKAGIDVLGFLKSVFRVNGKPNPIIAEIEAIKTNHLHEMKETLNRIEQNLTRNFNITFEKLDKLNEGIVYLKVKSNGK